MSGDFLILIFGWVITIMCAYFACSVYKTSRHGESLGGYLLVSALGLLLVGVMSVETFKEEPILTIGINALFVIIAILVIPAKRAIVRSIDLHHEQ